MQAKKISCRFCPSSSCFIKKNYFPEKEEILEQEKFMDIYKKGEIIFEAGTPIQGLYFVQNGLIEESMLISDNKARTVRFACDGQTFGPIGFENDLYTISAVAKEDSLVCFFENKIFYDMFRTSPKIVFDLMLFYSRQHCKTAYRLLCNSQMNLREKIADALLFIALNFGLSEQNELRESFSREDIASLTSTTTEQVSRQLSDFEKENIIEKRSRKIALLQPAKLKIIVQPYLT